MKGFFMRYLYVKYMYRDVTEFLGNQIKKGGKNLTLPGKISFSVTLDQIQRVLFFPKLR
jgi:hypothetical protein